MPLTKTLDYILESWLPTKLSVLIAGSTILLTLLAIGLPEYLQKIDILLTAEKRLLLRISAPLALLCLGTFIVLLLVVKHLKELRETHNKEMSVINEHHKRTLEEAHLKLTNFEAKMSCFQKEKDKEITELDEKYRTQISQLQEHKSSEKAKTAWKAFT